MVRQFAGGVMKLEYLVVAVATVAALVYYIKYDKPPKHTEAEADAVKYYVDDCEVDADFFA